MFKTVQEIAIYLHRFHNLDLFQQGWYQIKIKMRWEDDKYTFAGTTARFLQYEDNNVGIWSIEDNGFSTQPFRIKYARQDIPLSIMISFGLRLGEFEAPATSALVLKFELLHSPVLENGFNFNASLGALPAAIHEFRIPPKALLGLHSYCPVHFDSFHAVLVDFTVHVTLRNTGFTPPTKALDQGAYGNSQQISLLKALLLARDILLEELQNLSKAIDQKVDLTNFISNMGQNKLTTPYLPAYRSAEDIELKDVRMEMKHGAGKQQNGFEWKTNGIINFESDEMLQSLTEENLLSAFSSLANQVPLLWDAFLEFHRANTIKILEFLRDRWANDRRAEWSIWMVYTKVQMPHHYLRSGNTDSPQHSVRGRVSLAKKINDDPAESALARGELHRRGIAQMRINNQSIQDMQLFGDPLRVPLLFLERVVNAPFRTTSGNSYFSSLDFKDTSSILMEPSIRAENKLSTAGALKSRILRVVVFVHGFQGHHLDLRLVRNQWILMDPGAEFLMSEVNEDKTSGDFREMGSRLAQEVTSFLTRKIDKMSRSGGFKNIKLSFVGHSIGNLIIRTALTDGVMEPFLRYLYTYLSISGPHLGYLYCTNSLFNSGLWVLKKLRGPQCIHQLTFSDDSDLQNTFLYKLCKQKTLENFKNIILLSSPQDGYVPYHSARIELCQASSWDNSKKGKIFTEMLNNCLDQIRSPSSSEHRTFMRCDVIFDTSSHGKNLDTFIGRAAHIEFLETDIFVKFLMWSFPALFR